MNINKAMIKRIEEICKEKEESICEISLNAGMSPSALYDLIHGRTKSPKVDTVCKFCQGAKITLSQFFNAPYFDSIQEDE